MSPSDDPGITIRPVRTEDRAQIETILRASHNFTPEEVRIALEVLDDALAGDPGYTANIIESEGVAGYECHGPAPLTDGTFDLYWIVVDPRAQRRGYGRRLLRAAEEDVARRGGRLLLIETSSLPSYEGSVRMYQNSGYRIEARIRNFYRPDDDKLVLAKDILPKA